MAENFFDSSVHSYHIQTASISMEIRQFFERNDHNSLEFWDCPSKDNWLLHKVVDKETKRFNLTPLFPCKSSWEFSRKNKCDELIKKWRVTFKVLDDKGRKFMDHLDDDLNSIELMYVKGGSWLKYFSHSNSLCARATRAIVNHAPIGEY